MTVFKKWSELSLFEKLKVGFEVPKLFSWVESMTAEITVDLKESTVVTEQEVLRNMLKETAAIMRIYNTDDISTYRVFQLCIEHLEFVTDVSDYFDTETLYAHFLLEKFKAVAEKIGCVKEGQNGTSY